MTLSKTQPSTAIPLRWRTALGRSVRVRQVSGRRLCWAWLLALAPSLLLGCQHTAKSPMVPDAEAWTCSGSVVHRTDGDPIVQVQVWRHAAILGVTDSTGAYTVTIGAGPPSGDTLFFRKPDYSDAIGLLTAARVAGDHRLALDATMLLSKEDD